MDLNAICARSSRNSEYCGTLLVDLISLSNSVTALTVDACNSIVTFGDCLGSLVGALQASSSVAATYLPANVDTLATSLVQGCTALGVSDIASSIDGTEAPAFASSGKWRYMRKNYK
eukprot:m.15578 g.15578  ORF g.15578 m.15578 type:complete len:117 (+) comp7875_c0_seq1:537-887(+)